MSKKPERKGFSKFLSDLLFEETESIDLTQEEKPAPAAPVVQPAAEPVAPVQQQPVQEEVRPVIEPIQVVAPAPAPVQPQQPVQQQPRTTMQRIDVTQSIDLSSNQPPQPRRQEQPTESVFRVPGERRKAQPRVQPISADAPAVQKKTQPAKSRKEPAEKKPTRPVYNFQPVISPIFGVDEKDLNALKTTTSKLNKAEMEKARRNDNISPIISPIYGTDQEDSPATIQKSVEKSNIIEQMTVTTDKKEAEDEIPDFSLDDILKVGDEEYEKNLQSSMEDTAPLFTADEEDDGNDDDTMLISRAEYERLRRGGNG